MKKRNTKIALASLMAVSAIVPAAAASAEVGGDITRSGEVTLTPEKQAGGETAPSTPVPVEPEVKPAALKYLKYETVADGEYEVTIDFIDPDTGLGGYKDMERHIEKTAKLVVKEGKYSLQIKATKGSNSLITRYYITTADGQQIDLPSVSGSQDEYPHVINVPVDSINDITELSVWVYYETGGKVIIDKSYPFGIKVDKGQDLPQLYPTYVYKDGTNDKSTMQDTYLSSTSVVELNENGKYEVELTFPQGQYLEDFRFEGQTVALTESYTETVNGKENIIKIYNVEVDDISKIYSSDMIITVPFIPGYDNQEYKVQIQFGGKANPFTDAVKSFAYSNIVSLYNKGIFVEGKKFNPTDKLRRAHFALMMAKAFELEVPKTTKFTDIGSLNEPTQNAIKALNNYGIINGATDTTFNPNGNIKRYQAALMIDKMLEKQGIVANDGLTASFTDLSNMNERSKAAIAHLSSLDIINGKGNNKFDPTGDLTRQDMAIILDKTLKLIEKK